MKKQHTPGPWFYDDSLKGRLVINSERANVAVIPYLDREAIANARLIAAAPELLAALKALKNRLDHNGISGRQLPEYALLATSIDRAENGGRS